MNDALKSQQTQDSPIVSPVLSLFLKVFITHPPAKFNSKSVCKHRPLNSPSKAKQNTTICFFSSGEEKKILPQISSTNLKTFEFIQVYSPLPQIP